MWRLTPATTCPKRGTMKQSLTILFILITTLTTPALGGANTDLVDAIGNCEVSRVVINQTRTKAGFEFFRQLSSLWEELPFQRATYTAVVKEFPSIKYGSTVSVEINDMIIYRTALTTKSADIEIAAIDAAKAQRITMLKLEQRLSDDKNLESSEERL